MKAHKAEALGAIIKRLGGVGEEAAAGERTDYTGEYGLNREPSSYEAQRIAEIKERGNYCEKCSGLRECQYTGGDRGLEAIVMTSDLGGKAEGKRLYFGVKECRYLVEEGERRKEEALRIGSGIPEEHKDRRKYELEEREREVVNALLTGEERRLYISGSYRESEKVLSIIGNECLKLGLRVRYENVQELLSELRITSSNYQEKMMEVKGVEVLILEGLRGELSRYNDEQLGIILRNRNKSGKRSVVNGWRRLMEVRGQTGEQLERYRELLLN